MKTICLNSGGDSIHIWIVGLQPIENFSMCSVLVYSVQLYFLKINILIGTF